MQDRYLIVVKNGRRIVERIVESDYQAALDILALCEDRYAHDRTYVIEFIDTKYRRNS